MRTLAQLDKMFKGVEILLIYQKTNLLSKVRRQYQNLLFSSSNPENYLKSIEFWDNKKDFIILQYFMNYKTKFHDLLNVKNIALKIILEIREGSTTKKKVLRIPLVWILNRISYLLKMFQKEIKYIYSLVKNVEQSYDPLTCEMIDEIFKLHVESDSDSLSSVRV